MLLTQVEGFLEVARQGNLSRAAEGLFVTQPALTARLQSLEAELGAELFRRTRRGMELTDAGRAFLPYAERAVTALREGGELVGELGRGIGGELVIGAAPGVGTYVLPGILVRFAAANPNVRLVVRTGHSEEVLAMTLRNEVDVGLVRELRHPLVESRPLYDDELVLVVEPGHPFAETGRIRVESIAAERLILFDRTSSYYDLTNAVFREAGVAPRGVMELDNIDAAKQMVEQGLGVALLPATAVTAELADGRLTAVAIDGARPIRRRMVAIRRRDAGPPSGPVAAFYAVLPTIAGEGDRDSAPD
ncbi:MAG TPA: LysR family transcriptional regulator [Candidatus Limnocylindrales bacterium]|jgi:DNA-binding transcriptional LysR family regulator